MKTIQRYVCLCGSEVRMITEDISSVLDEVATDINTHVFSIEQELRFEHDDDKVESCVIIQRWLKQETERTLKESAKRSFDAFRASQEKHSL